MVANPDRTATIFDLFSSPNALPVVDCRESVDKPANPRGLGQGFSKFDGCPEQQALGLLAIAIKGGAGIKKTSQPCFQGVNVCLRGNLRVPKSRAIASCPAVRMTRLLNQ